MSSRQGHQEPAYQQADTRDPFSPQPIPQGGPARYYDEVDDRRRDTFASDSSGHEDANGERFYDQHGAYDPYGELKFSSSRSRLPAETHAGPPADTDSDPDVYSGNQHYEPSSDSVPLPPRMSEMSGPTFPEYQGPPGAREAYPAWTTDREIPLSKEEIEDIFLDLTQKFGFQRDSMRNMVCPISVPA